MEENKNFVPLTQQEKTKQAEIRAKQTREQQLAIIKANNELLEASKESIRNTDKLDALTKTERLENIDKLISENIDKAKAYYNASEEELNNITYKEPDPAEVEKYKKHIEKKGMTEKEYESKEMPIVINGDGVKSKRKRIPKKKRQEIIDSLEDEKIERVKNEENIMKISLADDEQIERKINENKRKEIERNTIKDAIVEHIDNTKISQNTSLNKNIITEDETVPDANDFSYDFDFKSIPSYVQYDMIPLPSEGQCYPVNSPLRCGRIPVAYLTASDENLIASPNLYRDGKIIDVILERKILDKRISVNELNIGDRDAIILWLRATGYGPEFPIVATNPDTDKKYDVTVDLSTLKYRDFDLKGDKNGNFKYITSNGDIIIYNFMNHAENEKFRKDILSQNIGADKVYINTSLNGIEETLPNLTDMSDSDIEDINGCIEDIRDIINANIKDIDENQVFYNTITEQMILFTKSINGIKDPEFIRNYIENMRSNESYKYRNTVIKSRPGINFEITVNIPESDGGGSFNTFLQLGNTVFLNVR